MVKQRLVDSLVEDLTPVRRRRLAASVLLWLTVSWVSLVTWMTLSGGPRPGLPDQLLEPRFMTEVFLGLAATLASLAAGMLLAVPGRVRVGRAWLIALVPIALWSGWLALGLFSPALEPSMVGMRNLCDIETVLLALIPLGLALLLAARFAPLSRISIGACLGLAASSVPALLMQLFCMYDPWHGLVHHLLPMALVMGIGAVAARLTLPRL